MATTYAIPDGRTVMAATLYTGTNATASISNAVNSISFQPDLIWIKTRSTTGNNGLVDSIRGNYKVLYSNLTLAEETNTAGTGVTAFSSNGFTLGTDPTTSANMNANGTTYVAWQWKAGTTSASNTSGTITSTVSAGATQGFSVVTYTGNNVSGATAGHGLGVAPKMVILKGRSSGSYDWRVYHASLTAGYNLALNTTAAQATSLNGGYISAVSSTTFTLTQAGAAVLDAVNGASPATYVAYCFAEVAGYSAFGSYTGNGSTDGPFVYCGFRPRFIMYKRTDTTGNWIIYDSLRSTYNQPAAALYPNLVNAEDVSHPSDFLSNGFKLRSTGADSNASGGTFIFMAFAENPFKYANAR